MEEIIVAYSWGKDHLVNIVRSVFVFFEFMKGSDFVVTKVLVVYCSLSWVVGWVKFPSMHSTVCLFP